MCSIFNDFAFNISIFYLDSCKWLNADCLLTVAGAMEIQVAGGRLAGQSRSYMWISSKETDDLLKCPETLAKIQDLVSSTNTTRTRLNHETVKSARESTLLK
jgi:hypothetical protein